MTGVVPPSASAGGGRSSQPADRAAGRFVFTVARLCVPLLAAALTLATALGVPSQALAADAPEGLDDTVTMIARTETAEPLAWAKYVDVTADAAADLLGKRRDQLSEGTPDRVYLVLLRGDFSLQAMGQERGPYLAFLYWRAGDTSYAADFTVLQRPLPLRSVGVPRVIEPFALAHPTLQRAWEYTLAFLFWFLPAILLTAAAVLCAWKRRSAWAYVLAPCVAAAVAAWQTSVLLHSMSGRSWDPVFNGIKLGVLVVVVCVDLAAAFVLLWRRPRPEAARQVRAGRQAWLPPGFLLLLVAAALSVVSLPWLGMTGE